MKLFDGSLVDLERSLDIRAERHTVLSSNLSNIDTPGFVATDVDFETTLAKAQAADDEPGSIEMEMMEAPHLNSVGLDGNTVDLDRTMAALAENGLQYGASAKVASKHLALLRTVVNDGVG